MVGRTELFVAGTRNVQRVVNIAKRSDAFVVVLVVGFGRVGIVSCYPRYCSKRCNRVR